MNWREDWAFMWILTIPPEKWGKWLWMLKPRKHKIKLKPGRIERTVVKHVTFHKRVVG